MLGGAEARAAQYRNPCFFTVCNYEQVLRDFLAIEAASWDLIILDEAQRIKNWEAKTSRVIKALRSRFALVLTGRRSRTASTSSTRWWSSSTTADSVRPSVSSTGTALVDKQKPGYSSKLERLDELFERFAEEKGRKIVLFSEWTTMLDLIEPLLDARGLGWVRLDGSVAQKKRQALVETFRRDPDCRLFLTTNAGSTGLNLQAANTVVNVDLPWNPAVLEQRIGRAHRMGQKRPVQVFVMITEETIEENLLATLSAKQELFLAVLDPDSNVEAVDMGSSLDELRQRLEVLLGAKPEAPVDESERQARDRETEVLAGRERLAEAGGRLVSAAFSFLGQMLPQAEPTPAATYLADLFRKQLSECLEEDEAGRPTLTVKLPDRSALDALAASLGWLLAEHAGPARSERDVRGRGAPRAGRRPPPIQR